MSATAFPKPALRPMLPADVPLLAAIFEESVETLAEEDYDGNQRAVWAAQADEPAFAEGLASALTLVATMGGSPVGFIAMENGGAIKHLYVHPALARQGVASMLCDAVEKLAGARGLAALRVDSSDTAKPFFDARGYVAQHRQTVELGDCYLGNTRMTKTL